MFKYTLDNKRYHTLNYYYKKKFNSKVFKVSLNAGFTCPNIDGTCGYGGCIYCSKLGSGEHAGNIEDDLFTQFEKIRKPLDKKWPNSKYIAYFQAHTNTYAPLPILKEKYEEVLTYKNVIGIAIATRPDSFTKEIYDYLEELNKRTYLVIELGLQTIHEKTSKLINRCHSIDCFKECVLELKRRNIEVVVHIINSLPYETKEMMLDTVRYLNKLKIDGIKIHMLHISKNTLIEKMYNKEKFHVLSKEEYIDIVCDQLEILDPNIVIHRLTSDPEKEDIIEPTWLLKKVSILNDIDKELVRRNTYQGFRKNIFNKVHQLLDERLREKDLVIDASCGNGNDTLYLARKCPKGIVFGFDIQEKALDNTKKLLDDNNITNYKLFLENHANIDSTLKEYQNKISTVIYNLGYLPNGDKNIKTTVDNTILSIKASLKLLNHKGFILIVVYPHEEGKKEATAIKKLDIPSYDINEYHNTNNIDAPYLIEITPSCLNNN